MSAQIRNFAIIANVDHGKSTLADRFLELTGIVQAGAHEQQLLDKNPISRERGITIKLAPVRMTYQAKKIRNPKSETLNEHQNSNDIDLRFRNLNLDFSSTDFILNLIDTPGHVDFSYEVERTLACVEGAILLVDATQGVQAQTIAHLYKAIELGVTIIHVVNKVDLPHAKIDDTKSEIQDLLSCKSEDIFEISAKTGQGVEALLDAVVNLTPPPQENQNLANIKSESITNPLQALIFDSYYDNFRGVIAFVRVFGGELKKNDTLFLHANEMKFTTTQVGIFTPELQPKDYLSDGEIGYVVTGLKDIHLVRVGDTLLHHPTTPAMSGYRPSIPMVFSSMFPTDPDDYLALKSALEKLMLNDSAITYEAIYSKALGSGFRVGFLGLLHADVVGERLEREQNMSLVLTSPVVNFQISENEIKEPIASVLIVTPPQYLSAVIKLLENSRSTFGNMHNTSSHVHLSYLVPLAELMGGFFDKLKNTTSGYATLQWELKDYQTIDADRLTILINDEPVEEFSEYVVKERAYQRGTHLTSKLKELIPRQNFEVKIQAHFGGRIIASSRIAPYRKDVTEKLYGGDRTRKDKLLKQQKKGKKLMKSIGRVEVPKEVFLKLFSEQ